MDDVVYKGLMMRFREPPDMDAPIDKYFQKQQECQLRSQDADDPVTDKGMAIVHAARSPPCCTVK